MGTCLPAAGSLGAYAPDAAPSLAGTALGRALDFRTWQSLVRQQRLEDQQASAVMAAMVSCLAAGA